MDGDRGAGRALGEGDALDLHRVVAVGLDGDHVADGLGRAGGVAAAAEGGRVLLAAVEGGWDAGLAGGRGEGDPLGRVLPGGGHLQHLGRVDGGADLPLAGRAADWRVLASSRGSRWRGRRSSCGRPGVGRGDAGGRGDVLVLVAPGAVGQLGRPGPVPGVDAGEAEADQRRRLQVGVQVGPEQPQVGQAQGAEQDRVAGVDVDPVGGVLAGGDGESLDEGAGRVVEPGLGPVTG